VDRLIEGGVLCAPEVGQMIVKREGKAEEAAPGAPSAEREAHDNEG